MKILHSIDTWLHPTENWIHDQICATDIDQDVICSSLLNPLKPLPNGRIFTRESTGPKEFVKAKLSNRFNLNFSIKDNFKNYENYDILFSHFGWRAWMDLLFTRKIRFKRIVRFYGIDLDFTYRKKYWPERYHLIFETYDKMVVEGTAMKQKLQLFGCDPEKIVILHHGVIPFFEKPIKDFVNSKKAFKCLICGRFVEKKGFGYAVKALGELKNKYSVPVELTIIGDAPLQNYSLEKEKILRLDREYKLNARFLGMISLEEIKREMNKNDFFISPSVTTPRGDVEGGFPTTLIHAANHGMILVGTTHCDFPEIIHQGKNGYVSPERDVNSLVDNLRTLSEASPKELAAMSLYSYQLVRNQFNLVEEGRQLKALYTSLIPNNGQQESARFAGNLKFRIRDKKRKPRV